MRTATAIVLAGLVTGPALGQSPTCTPQATLVDCYNQLYNQLKTAANNNSGKAVIDAAAMEAGKAVAATDVPEVARKAVQSSGREDDSSLRNLLPSFLASLGIDGLTETNTGLVFEKPLFGGSGHAFQLVVKGVALYNTPLFPALKAKLPEDLTATELSRLEDSIADFDQADIGVALSLEDKDGSFRAGRDPRDYHDIYQALFLDAVTSRLAPQLLDLQGALKEHPAAKRAAAERGWPSDWTSQLAVEQLRAELGPEATQELILIVAGAAPVLPNRVKTLDTSWHAARDRLDDLVGNQPQWLLDATWNLRDGELTGPDEFTASVRFEWGFGGSLNGLARWCKGHPNLGTQGQQKVSLTPSGYPTIDCLESYLGLGEGPRHIDAKPNAGKLSHRISITGSYTDTDVYSFSLPEHDFTFALDATEKWEIQATYGFYIPGLRLVEDQGEDGSRLELNARYEDVTGDPERQSRLVAHLTLTQKLTDKASASIGAVWAEKPEYRGEVDHELSARFGLAWSGIPALERLKKNNGK